MTENRRSYWRKRQWRAFGNGFAAGLTAPLLLIASVPPVERAPTAPSVARSWANVGNYLRIAMRRQQTSMVKNHVG